MAPDFQEQRAWYQQNLIDFLNTELDLGLTFFRSAQLHMDVNNNEHYIRSRANAQNALEAIRKFEGRIADPGLWHSIHKRADQLEKLISTL
jgi:hypothetical protein